MNPSSWEEIIEIMMNTSFDAQRCFALSILLLMVPLLAALGCGVEQEVSQKNKAVVYGIDDRRDVYDYPDEVWKARALESTVAIIEDSKVNMKDPQNIQITDLTLKQSQYLCDGERFLNQITAASCSGTLIDDDKVMTAGHCFWDEEECQASRIVFHYAMRSETDLTTITVEDVFQCTKILVRQQTSSSVDYLIFQLDRPATPRFKPALLRLSADPLLKGTRLMVIGFSSGMPMKIDDGGTVIDPRPDAADYFLANTDTFSVNSGSGVYDLATGEVAGILVRGETDYQYDPEKECLRMNVCPEDGTGCRGEAATYVAQALKGLCQIEIRASWCNTSTGVQGRR